MALWNLDSRLTPNFDFTLLDGNISVCLILSNAPFCLKYQMIWSYLTKMYMSEVVLIHVIRTRWIVINDRLTAVCWLKNIFNWKIQGHDRSLIPFMRWDLSFTHALHIAFWSAPSCGELEILPLTRYISFYLTQMILEQIQQILFHK